MSKNNSSILFCNFCGRSSDEVVKLVAGPTLYICDECVSLCSEIIKGDKDKDVIESKDPLLLKPFEIKKILDSYVVGQERAKRILSVSVYNHFKRVFSTLDVSDVELKKSNILLIGPTGSGKTLLAKTLAKILNVPFAIADATTLTEAGYVGDDVESVISNLLNAAGGEVKLAERGIVYIDEIDKITRRGENPSITRDVSGEGVQQGLLKIIEGSVCNVPMRGGRKHPNQELVKVDTSQILFICGGAFSGLSDIVSLRKGKGSLGFKEQKIKDECKKENYLQDLSSQDLLKYGFIPEFIGRLPVIACLDPLDISDLVRILKEPSNSITKQFQKLFLMDGVKLTFTEQALLCAAKEAFLKKTGARGLRRIFENALLDIMYEIPSNKKIKEVEFDCDAILKKRPPKIL